YAEGLAVALLFSSVGIGYSFQGGYEPAGPSGVVTRVGFDPGGQSGIVTKSYGRAVLTIDNAPAAEVYNGWIGDRLESAVRNGGNILRDTTMCPLALDVGEVDGIQHYLRWHPVAALPVGGLRPLAPVVEGKRR